MAEEIRFPRLGWSMEDGRFVGWLKEDGQSVLEGEPLFEMEGEKAVQEIESIGSGTLYKLPSGPKPDTVVPVGCLLGYLLGTGEPPPSDSAGPNHQTATNSEETDTQSPAEEIPAEQAPEEQAPGAASPSVRRMARQRGIDLQSVIGTGRSGRVTRQDIERADLESRQEHVQNAPRATPRARRLAKQLGVDWKNSIGSGRGGRIREQDIVRLANQTPKSGELARGKLFTQRRRAIAERLKLSRDRTIPVTLHTRCDATRIVDFRSRIKASESRWVPSFNDIIAQQLAIVLAQHPALRVRWNHDHSDLVPVDAKECHVGLAVDTPDGLLVPVIHAVTGMSLEQLTIESKRLIGIAKSGRLTRAQMEGGVITLTNLGSFGIDAFSPIINYPEVAILGIGAIRREVVFMDAMRIEARHFMTLSLTFDHAAMDGAPAAAFLKDLVESLEAFEA